MPSLFSIQVVLYRFFKYASRLEDDHLAAFQALAATTRQRSCKVAPAPALQGLTSARSARSLRAWHAMGLRAGRGRGHFAALRWPMLCRAGEEITYDYKFDREEDRSNAIPCMCGALKCNKFLN